MSTNGRVEEELSRIDLHATSRSEGQLPTATALHRRHEPALPDSVEPDNSSPPRPFKLIWVLHSLSHRLRMARRARPCARVTKSPAMGLSRPAAAFSHDGAQSTSAPSLETSFSDSNHSSSREMPRRPQSVRLDNSRSSNQITTSGDGPTISVMEIGARRSDRSRQRILERDREDIGAPHPKRFLCCFPWITSRQLRSQVLTCFVSGGFVLMLLAVYLGLSLSNNIRQGQLTLMILLIILAAASFFCFSVLRLCLLLYGPRRLLRRRQLATDAAAPGGYVVPFKPIPVLLARDEEVAGDRHGLLKPEPPAYGLWRESVRSEPGDPHLVRSTTCLGARPPSYCSDDGIAYVMEVRPRSVAPPTSVTDPVIVVSPPSPAAS